MKFKCIVSILLFIFLFSCLAFSAENFSTKVELKFGQLIALTINSIQKDYMELNGWDAIVLTTYNQTDNKLEIEIFGSKKSIDGAKSSLTDYIKKVFSPMIKKINEMYSSKITAQDVTIIYTNKRSLKSYIIFEKEQYLIP